MNGDIMSKDLWQRILDGEPLLPTSAQSTDSRYLSETDVTEIVVNTNNHTPAASKININ